jgi:hypothetical protein
VIRHDQPGPRPGAPTGQVIAGATWYRKRIRLLGPLFGLIPMALFGAISVIALQVGDGRTSGLIGLVSGVSAAPGLLIAGAPLADEGRYPLAVLASIPLWLILGWIASRRATKRSLASWRDYARELIWLTIGVLLGAIGALVAATTVLGESLIL